MHTDMLYNSRLESLVIYIQQSGQLGRQNMAQEQNMAKPKILETCKGKIRHGQTCLASKYWDFEL